MKPVDRADSFDWLDIPQCNACQSPRQRILGHRGGSAHRSNEGLRTKIVTCQDCGLIFPNPMPLPRHPSVLYETAPEEYFRYHQLDQKRHNASRLLQDLEKKTNGRRLLDVGCGQGVLLAEASHQGWDPEGIDVSERFARYAREQFNLSVRIGDISSVPFEPESFDVVVLSAILEHLPDPHLALVKVSQALKPNGLVWIDVPNEQGLYYRIGNLWNRLRGRDWVVNLSPTFSPGHLHGFSPKSLSILLRRVGFPNVSIQLYQGRNCLDKPRNIIEAFERRAVDAVILAAKLLHQGDGIIATAFKCNIHKRH